MKRTTTTLLATLTLTFAACGGDDESGDEAAESTATPETALQEIDAVRAGLADAEAKYEQEDTEAAAEVVNETYLQHFELVEGPLEEVEPELNEELEEQIREELVAEIESGASTKEVAALIAEIQSGLDEAAAALK